MSHHYPKKKAARTTIRKLKTLAEGEEARQDASRHTEKRVMEEGDEIRAALSILAKHGKQVGLDHDRIGLGKGDEAFELNFDALFTAATTLGRNPRSGFAISKSASERKGKGKDGAGERGGKWNPDIVRISCEIGAFVDLCRRMQVTGEHVERWAALLEQDEQLQR
jgi:hypothetical protein